MDEVVRRNQCKCNIATNHCGADQLYNFASYINVSPFAENIVMRENLAVLPQQLWGSSGGEMTNLFSQIFSPIQSRSEM